VPDRTRPLVSWHLSPLRNPPTPPTPGTPGQAPPSTVPPHGRAPQALLPPCVEPHPTTAPAAPWHAARARARGAPQTPQTRHPAPGPPPPSAGPRAAPPPLRRAPARGHRCCRGGRRLQLVPAATTQHLLLGRGQTGRRAAGRPGARQRGGRRRGGGARRGVWPSPQPHPDPFLLLQTPPTQKPPISSDARHPRRSRLVRPPQLPSAGNAGEPCDRRPARAVRAGRCAHSGCKGRAPREAAVSPRARACELVTPAHPRPQAAARAAPRRRAPRRRAARAAAPARAAPSPRPRRRRRSRSSTTRLTTSTTSWAW
jgi:hypothetical protein